MPRYSVHSHDAGFQNYLAFCAVDIVPVILLDGKPVKDCHTADEDQGFVLCYQWDDFEEKREEVVRWGTVRVQAVERLN